MNTVRRVRTLYAATTNRGKLAELQAAAAAQLATWILEPAPSLATLPPCPEDGATFHENARAKAAYYSGGLDALLFAEDSGLEVPALSGEPGVRSARYAGESAGAAENNRKLLDTMRPLAATQRAARFVCVIALARGGEVLATFEGTVEGVIAHAPAGEGGFGYDPLFFLPEAGRTFAELAPAEKLRYSHRGRAFRRLAEALQSGSF